ncbi:DUF5996 family protein [Methylocella sp.]|uniref:DUF5996 family protein n=1 Tax=Methylocella sp. TaxID=1978226 RepID=UPI0037842814
MTQVPAEALRRAPDPWPELDCEAWRETAPTLRLMTQIVGKVRLRRFPRLNHCWTATLHVDARGLATGLMFHEGRGFEIRFDFLAGELIVEASDGARFALPLEARPIAQFYGALMDGLAGIGLGVEISGRPNEIADAIPFARDGAPRAYDGEAARRFWTALLSASRVFEEFRALFVGKASPPQFYWGSFDLAVTRFSGRAAPPHPGGAPNLPLAAMREAYSHEVFTAGFRPGCGGRGGAAFYCGAWPLPRRFAEAAVEPEAAFFSGKAEEFILPYDRVRAAASPEASLTRFLQSAYEAAAGLGRWDRAALERHPHERP